MRSTIIQRRNTLRLLRLISLGAMLFCGNANAYQVLQGNVSLVQPTSLPTTVWFTMTGGSSLCPAGTWLFWQNADASNNRAVYATLLGALLSGRTVHLYIADGDSTCKGVSVHVAS